jgi:type 1 glutamine amidotransferase
VLVYNYVDVNPTTGNLRLHTGGGADERLLQELGSEHGFTVVLSDRPSVFTTEDLATFDVVVFASPNYAGKALDDAARRALEAFVRGGGGWVGWHYALWVEKDWAFMKELGGGMQVSSHGPPGTFEPMRFDIVDQAHPVVRGLGQGFTTNVEDWLSYTGDLGPNATVLATCDLGLADRRGWPVIWVSDVGQGRAFFTMLGHAAQAFSLTEMKMLTWNALRWTARVGSR